jgi:hypothetical protein
MADKKVTVRADGTIKTEIKTDKAYQIVDQKPDGTTHVYTGKTDGNDHHTHSIYDDKGVFYRGDHDKTNGTKDVKISYPQETKKGKK